MRFSTSSFAVRCATAGSVLLGALAQGACVDTSWEDLAAALPCSKAVRASESAESVVWLAIDLGDLGDRYCSGVIIAPRLVLTSFTCVSYPVEADTDVLERDETLFPRPTLDYFDPKDFSCDPGSWMPLEDGRLSGQFGGIRPFDAVRVGLVGSNSTVSPVEALAVAPADSRCTEGLALLLLREAAGVPSAPVRLVDIDRVGEAVVMSSARAEAGQFVRETLEMSVETVTDYAGSPDTPPHSLRLSPSACPYERGAGIISVASGALIGIVSSGLSERCGDTTGNTVAIRLPSFRQMLLDTSERYGQMLVSEFSPVSADIPACFSSTLGAPTPLSN